MILLKKYWLYIFAIGLTAVSFIYRFSGITSGYPFWVDEFSTARNAREIIQHGLGVFDYPHVVIERHNITTHLLTVLSFTVFGQTETAARIPFVLIGSFLPVSVFVVGRKLAGTAAGVCAAILTVFSYFMITWARQARGYEILDLAILWTMYFYLSLYDKKGLNRRNVIGLIVAAFIGLITHPLYYITVGAVMLHYAFTKRAMLLKFTRKRKTYLIGIPLIVVAIAIMYVQDSLRFFTSSLFGANNVWYYHSFLWRQYALITFLGILGLIILFFKNRSGALLIAIYMVFHLIFINFMFGHYLTKYTLPIFPFLLIGFATTVAELSRLIIEEYLPKIKYKKYIVPAVPIFIMLAVVKNGDKFVTRPVLYYSVNKDFREIANIDYHQIYDIIKSKGKLAEHKTAVIETWPDRAKWYLGNNFPDLYFFRWENEPGKVSGHIKKTLYTVKPDGTKITAGDMPVKFVGQAADLKLVMKKYPRGFLYIDDATLPKDVIDFAEKHLKKEIYLDHYPLDENPYSLWPATLYSWGI